MKRPDYQHLLNFLNSYEDLIQHFCNVQDDKINKGTKEHLVAYIQETIESEPNRLKLHQNEKLNANLLAFHNSCLEFLK